MKASSLVSLFNGRNLSGWVVMGDSTESFVVDDESILVTGKGNFPNWLRSERKYENFILRLEYMTLGWCESGILIHAPLYGRASRTGFKIHLRHEQNQEEGHRSNGSLFDLRSPLVQASKPSGEWNSIEIVSDWPRLRVTLNGQLIHDLDRSQEGSMRWRLRRGYIGFQDLGTPIRFRNIRLQELPPRQEWTSLSNGTDLTGWTVRGEAQWSVINGALVGSNGDGYLISQDSFSNFELQVFVRTSRHANGGVFYRWQSPQERGYEVQVYNVKDATNPTGSIYGVVPAIDPDSRDGEWFLMQIVSYGPSSLVLIDGKPVASSDALAKPDSGHIALQMHSRDAQVEYLHPRIRRLESAPYEQNEIH